MTEKKAARGAVRKPRAGKAAVAVETIDTHTAPKALFVAEMSVRWRDLDAFNHVNNATYLTYLEEARLQWLRHVPGPWFSERSMPVLAASELNYRRPIEWPAQLAVELYAARMGNSSMTVAHRIVDATDPETLYSDGHVVMVWMDPSSGTSVVLPDCIRQAAENGVP